MVCFLDLQSARTEMNNMNKTYQRLPKQQQINKTELNPLILNREWGGGGGRNRGVNLSSPYFLSQFLPPPYIFEPISPSSLLFWTNFSLLPKRLRFFFSLLTTFSPYFSLLPTFFGPFLPPPYSVPPPSQHQLLCINWTCIQYWLTIQFWRNEPKICVFTF